MTAEQGSPTTEAGRQVLRDLALARSLAWNPVAAEAHSIDHRYLVTMVPRIEAEAYEQGRKAGLTEAIAHFTAGVNELEPWHEDEWVRDPIDPDLRVFRKVEAVDRAEVAAVIDTLTRLREGS